jgi:hypothetical protein
MLPADDGSSGGIAELSRSYRRRGDKVAGKTDGAAKPPSEQSRRGLDWLNFFMSDVQQGFGSFVSFYLADLHWTKEMVSFRSNRG